LGKSRGFYLVHEAGAEWGLKFFRERGRYFAIPEEAWVGGQGGRGGVGRGRGGVRESALEGVCYVTA